jgi:hypothetical protein
MSKEKHIQQNLDMCDNIVDICEAMLDSEGNEPNTYLKLDEIQQEIRNVKKKAMELRELYQQIIT